MTPLRVARFIGLFAVLLALTVAGTARADGPAGFIKSAGSQLVAAARSNSPSTLYDVINRYSDLPDIGLHSLGAYRKHLPSSRRASYYDGVARFMTRYFIDQARQFPVASFKVYTESNKVSWGYEVDSVVTLTSGELHRLRWHVVPRQGGYKVRDVSIVGVWLTPISMVNQQRNLFEGYIRDKGGISALLSALGA
jgi:phospholipid transport system substrate-binding protein